MKRILKKAGLMLLIITMLAQSVGSYAYAAGPAVSSTAFTEQSAENEENNKSEISKTSDALDDSSNENEQKTKLPDSGEDSDTGEPEAGIPALTSEPGDDGETPDDETYSLNFEALEALGIIVLPDKDSYNEGDEVSFTIENTSGREIESVTAALSDGTEIELMETDGTYTFTMPAAEVSISVTLKLFTISIDAAAENAEISFDKDEYLEGDTVTATITPNEGYAIDKRFVSVISDGAEVSFESEEKQDALVVTFVLGDKDVELTAAAKMIHNISFTYTDLNGDDCSALFETSVNTEKLIEGEEIKISVAYTGNLGWAADVTGASGNMDFEMTSDSVTFYMPDEDVTVNFQEIEAYETGNLDAGDTELGEDSGDGSDVTTQKEFEPDVTLGKTAKWDDIEEGTATLTLTEKDISDMADAPSDYIIVLDRTTSMVVNSSFGSSVCYNPNHHYFLRGREVTLVDYGRGYYKDTGTFFRTEDYNHIYWTGDFKGSSAKLWESHRDASGRLIAPRVANGCIDRMMLAQDSIKQILDKLEEQNNTVLQDGAKNRVMYWTFSGPAAGHGNGLWNEMPEFSEDISAVKAAIKYECYSGTYYYESFKQILKKLQEKQKDEDRKNIPTKVIFISDGYSYDSDSVKAQVLQMSKEIRAMEDTELYTILIGDTADSDAGKLLKSYVKSGNFATITQDWSKFLSNLTKVQQKKFSIDAVDKVITDKINTEYWEVVGEPILESGNGTASLSSDKSTLTWNIPEGAEKTYTCKLQLKLKDEYRYLLADTSYPTNADEEGVSPEEIAENPEKAGAVISYKISGGKYNTETRTVGIKSPALKYGTVNFEGTKNWTVEGSNADSIKIQLTRTMPGSTVATEVNNTTTNVTKKWQYSFTVRQMADGTTYPLIKYNNAGQEITYEVKETVPEHYIQLSSTKSEADGVVDTELYNEPYKVKAQLTKIDEETKNPLSGAEFSVYMWSALKKAYVPYKGTTNTGSTPHETGTLNGAAEIVKLKEGAKGVYTTPVWLYYSSDNQGKFRIIETKAPEGYFGDWKDDDITNTDADKNVYDFEISNELSKNGETIIVSNTEDNKFENQRVKGEITFSKLDLEGKTATAQGDATLAYAVYKLYAAEDIMHQDGTTGVLFKKGEEIKVSETASLNGLKVYEYDPDGKSELMIGFQGRACITNLELGRYYLKEVSASEGYLVDPDIYEVDVTYENEKVEVVKIDTDVFERVMKQSLSFYKYTADNNSDQLDPMKGAGFSVYLVSDLENGKYTDLSDEELVQAVIDDMRNSSTLQYDTYESYAPATVYAEKDSEDVTSGRLVKSVKYAGGKTYKALGENEYLVSELESDKNGVVKTPGLPYGRYIVIETKTPDGKTATRPFVINVTSDEKDDIVDGDGKGTPLQDMQLTVLLDRPIMSLIRIMKRDAQSKNIVLKEGASYVIHDVDGAWFDYITNEMTSAQKKAYREAFGDLVAQYSQGTYYGTKEDPFVTKLVKAAGDETANVYIETPVQLPSGTYELEEISAPEGYILQGEEGVIAKKAALSGNGTFYETEENGAWTETPQGRTRFIVSNNESVYDETAMSYVTTVKQDNEPAVGKISIYAEGEALVSAEQIGSTLADKLVNKLESFFGYLGGIFGLDTPAEDELTEAELSVYQDYEFEYEVKPIEGAQFEIRAAEDIYSPEGGANAEKLFSKGELVVTLTTDEKGQTWTGQEDWTGTDIAKGLPLGKYTVTQTIAGYGFALSEENAVPREIEIAYAGQTVPVIYKDTAYENPRQKVNIEVTKKDKETDTLLSGATFGLYAEEDIRNYNGKVVVKAGTLVATAGTYVDENGNVANAVFAPDLPLAKYYIREIKAPYGYVTSKDKIAVDASYNADQREVIKVTETVKNLLTRTQINLMDYFTEVELDGAQLSVMDEEGNFFTTILSVHDGNTVIRGLEIGKTYTVKELVSPEGYHYHLYIRDGYETTKDDAVELEKEYLEGNVSDSVRFTVQDIEDLQVVSVFNKPITGELTVEKTGEVAVSTEKQADANGNVLETPVYEIKGLPGAEYALRAKEDIVYPDGYTGTIFPAGDVVLDKYAELKDTGVLKNYSLEVIDGCGEITDVSDYVGIKYDADSTEQEILDFYKEHGNEVERQIPSEEEIETGKTLYNGTPVKYTLKTNEDGIVKLSGLPLGEYEVVEVKAPEGYARDKAECIHAVSVTVPEDISGRPEETVEVKTAYENAKQETDIPDTPVDPVPVQIIYHPSILVCKEADKDVYDKGETVIYSITVVNNGDVDLKDLTVEDSLAGGIIKTIDYLKVSEQYTFDYEYVIPADAEPGSRIDNVVYAAGTPDVPEPGVDENGNPVIVDPSSYEKPSDSDIEKVFVKGKDIIVKKTAEKRIYRPGETAVYHIEVINPNAYELVNVKVEDTLSGTFKLTTDNKDIHVKDDGTVKIDSIPAYGKVTLFYTYEIPADAEAGEIENIVIAAGTSTEEEFMKPEIRIEKYAEKYFYSPGETVQYTIVVTNTGKVDLENVIVEDNIGGTWLDNPEIGDLAAGESKALCYEYAIPDDAESGTKIENIAVVTGTEKEDPENLDDPEQPKEPVKDTDGEEVIVVDDRQPAIRVKKSVNKQTVRAGETIEYTIVVTNIGNVDLEDVIVTDDNVDLEEKGNIGNLAVGESVTITYPYTVAEDADDGSKIPNTAVAIGTEVITLDPDDPAEPEEPRKVTDKDDEIVTVKKGEEVEDDDDETIIVQNPKIAVTKDADKKLYLPGETAKYTIMVTNTGDCDLVDVIVNEELLKDGTFVSSSKGTFEGAEASIGELAVGESVTLEFEYTVPEAAENGSILYNVVSVTGTSKPVIDPMVPEKPDGTPNYLPTETVSDNDMEEIHVSGFRDGLSVTKYSVDEGIKTPKAGAEFTLYAKEDVKNIFGTLIYAAGTEIETAVSGEDGAAYFTADVPIGVYKVLETKAPDGHYSSDKEITFDLSQWKNDDSVHYLSLGDFVENPVTVVNIKLVDDMTGNELKGAGLQVIDEEGNVVDAWFTKVEDGYVIKGLKVDTKYTIVETVPRDGYLTDFTGASLNSSNAAMEKPEKNQVSFVISDVTTGTNAEGKLDKTTIPEDTNIILENAFVVGEVKLNKDGEKLESWTLIDKLAAFVKSVFNFSRQPLEGVEFTIYAKEDIVHPDGITGVVFRKGDVVSTGVRGILKPAVDKTNKLGIVSFEEMYLGSYEIVETATVKGFNLDIEPRDITFVYADGRTSPVKAEDGDIEWTNERQTVRIEVTKRDIEHTEKTIQGAVFGLYNKENIRNYKNEIIVEADTLLELSETDENGVAVFESDLPLGKYYIKETAAPKGYASSDEVIEIDASYDSGKEVLEFKEDFFNDFTKVEINKIDSELGILISGAKLELRDSAGNTVASWTSSEKEGFYIERLPIGTYRVIETERMEGYEEASPLVIKVKDTAEKQTFTFENTPKADDENAETPVKIEKYSPQSASTVKTGDNAPIILLAAMLVVSVMGILFVRKRK